MTYLSKLFVLLAMLSLALTFSQCTSTGDDDDDATSTAATSVTAQNTATKSLAEINAASPCKSKASDGECITVDIKGQQRAYLLRKPLASSSSAKQGLLLLLHGLGDSTDFMMEYYQARRIADTQGYVLAVPRGTQLQGFVRKGEDVWNANAACCFYDAITKPELTPPDDVAFLSRIIDDQVNALKLDSNRVVVMGYSNGAFMTNRLACEASSKISAIVVHAGTIRRDIDQCKPENKLSVLHIHGTDDASVNYLGRTLNQRVLGFEGLGGIYTAGTFPAVEASVNHWAALNGCSLSSTSSALGNFTISDAMADYDVIGKLVPVNTDLAFNTPRTANLTTYGGCQDGTSVQLITVDKGTHTQIYNTENYYKTVQGFLVKYDTRSAATKTELTDAPHTQINDKDVALVPLRGDSVIPAVTTTAYGVATLTLASGSALVSGSSNVAELRYQVDLYNLDVSTITSIKLVNASSSTFLENLYTQGKNPAFEGKSLYGTIALTSATLFSTGDWLLEIRSAANPNGELRGKAVFGNPPYKLSAGLSGANELSVVDNAASGLAEITLGGAGIMTFKITLSSLKGAVPTAAEVQAKITAMHIHRGKATENGGVIISQLPIPTGLPSEYDFIGEGKYYDIVSKGGFKWEVVTNQTVPTVVGYAELMGINRGLYEEMVSYPERFYVNGHSADAPNGLLRGQLGTAK